MRVAGVALLATLACAPTGLHGHYVGTITGRTGTFVAELSIGDAQPHGEDGCEVSGTLALSSALTGEHVSTATVCGLTDGEWLEAGLTFPSYAGQVWTRLKYDEEENSLRGWVDGNVFERAGVYWRWAGGGPKAPPVVTR